MNEETIAAVELAELRSLLRSTGFVRGQRKWLVPDVEQHYSQNGSWVLIFPAGGVLRVGVYAFGSGKVPSYYAWRLSEGTFRESPAWKELLGKIRGAAQSS